MDEFCTNIKKFYRLKGEYVVFLQQIRLKSLYQKLPHTKLRLRRFIHNASLLLLVLNLDPDHLKLSPKSLLRRNR